MTLGYDLLGCHPVQRLEQRHFFHTHGLDAAQHYLLSFGDPHSLSAYPAPPGHLCRPGQ